MLAEYLIGLGHRRFGLISAPTDGNDRSRERGAGVREALAAARPRARRGGHVPTARSASHPARSGLRAIIASRARPTAIIATNDVFAVGAMVACREMGIRIPDELSITGVDSTDLGATQTPALTSVQTPIVEIGRAAAMDLIARLEGRPADMHQQLPFTLVKRGSTAPPARRRRADTARAAEERSIAASMARPHVLHQR